MIDGMKLIVITAEHFFKDEALWINQLMGDASEEYPAQDSTLFMHLRKPGSRAEEMELLIAGIDPRFYKQMVLHDHLHLAQKYNLGGVHLNLRNEQQYDSELGTCNAQQGAQTIRALQANQSDADMKSHYWKTCRISRSCHSLEEVVKYKEQCSYVTLSPIFNSISKQGYCAAFTQEELKRAKDLNVVDQKVVALGGIDAENIAQIKELGFGGAAVLGTIWKSRTLDEARMNLKLLVNNYK